MSRAVSTQTVRARVEQVAARVRWFDANGRAVPSPTLQEEPFDDDGSQLKAAIVRWLEKTAKQQ